MIPRTRRMLRWLATLALVALQAAPAMAGAPTARAGRAALSRADAALPGGVAGARATRTRLPEAPGPRRLLRPDLQVEVVAPASSHGPARLRVRNAGAVAVTGAFAVVSEVELLCEAGKLTANVWINAPIVGLSGLSVRVRPRSST